MVDGTVSTYSVGLSLPGREVVDLTSTALLAMRMQQQQQQQNTPAMQYANGDPAELS